MSAPAQKRTLQETTENVVDMDTGEVVYKTNTRTSLYPREPDYIKLYVDNLCSLIELPDALKNTLNMMLAKLDYEGYITLSTRFRKTMATRLGIKDQTLRNRINQLCKKEMLIREATNEYIANPQYFARGQWQNIVEQRRSFEMRVRYSQANGREIVTETVDDDNQQDLFQ